MNENILRLSLSENPYLIPIYTKEKLISEIDKLNLYPFDYYLEVKKEIADFYNLSLDNIVISNGSDEMIFLCALKYGGEKKNALISNHTFEGYKDSLDATHTRYLALELKANHIDLKEYYKSIDIDTSLIYICNPHNPTGTIISKNELECFVQYCNNKHIKVVVDEAYMEYSDHREECSVVKLIDKYDNLFVIKTLSKIFPMAGIRFGFMLSQEKNIQDLKSFKMLPYNVNRIACVMAIECIKDRQFLNIIISSNRKNKIYLYSKFDELKLEYVETNTNFIMIKIPSKCNDFVKKLKEDFRIEVKELDALGFNGYIRVTIGSEEQVFRFITAVFKIIGG